jgi:hypothetical protein
LGSIIYLGARDIQPREQAPDEVVVILHELAQRARGQAPCFARRAGPLGRVLREEIECQRLIMT